MISLPTWQTCIPCKTGSEWEAAQKIERIIPEARVLVPMQAKHKSTNGVKSIVHWMLFPGYVFLYAPSQINRKLLHLVPELCFRDYTALTRSDMEFLRWIWEQDGFIDVSDAKKENGSVHFLRGPIRDMEQYMKKTDRWNRNALMEIPLCGQVFRLWFAFRWVDEVATA